MRIIDRSLIVLISGMGGYSAVHDHAGADEVWYATHQFCGSATANVFDGGPPLSESGCSSIVGGFGASFSASDTTQPGSQGASAHATNLSGVFTGMEITGRDILALSVDLWAAYSPSPFPGGDNPGGMADAELSSVIEFRMPVDKLDWDYELLVDEDVGYFEGTTHVTLENVTQSQTILELTQNTNIVYTVLHGHAGDLIRVSMDASGAGSMGPGSGRDYFTRLQMRFIPEPSALLSLTFGAVFLHCLAVRKRQRVVGLRD